MTYSFFFILITNCYKFYISVSLMQNYKIQIMNECLFKVETKISTVEMVPFLPIMLPTELKVCFRNSFSWGPHTKHTELKYSIAGVEFQATKQFILSSFCVKSYLSRWSNGLRHQARSQKAVGSNPTWGDLFF